MSAERLSVRERLAKWFRPQAHVRAPLSCYAGIVCVVGVLGAVAWADLIAPAALKARPPRPAADEGDESPPPSFVLDMPASGTDIEFPSTDGPLYARSTLVQVSVAGTIVALPARSDISVRGAGGFGPDGFVWENGYCTGGFGSPPPTEVRVVHHAERAPGGRLSP